MNKNKTKKIDKNLFFTKTIKIKKVKKIDKSMFLIK